ncbi:MAG: MOSC domain-containing protein [Methanobacteriaceae archaeon]
MGKIIAVCRSFKKQTKKEDVKSAEIIKNQGLLNDAHADPESHRQISLLAYESITEIRETGLNVKYGDFAENITTKGIDLKSLKIGTLLIAGEEVLLEVTQIGKECHSPCEIYKQVGKCVMPSEGVFCRVLNGGNVEVGDEIKVHDDSL